MRVRRTTWLSIGTSLVGMVVSPNVVAQVEAASSTPPTTAPTLERVEVRAKRPGNEEIRRRANVAKQIYDQAELERFGDNDLAAVVGRLPGINVQGGEVRLRGFAASFSQILINGDPAPPGFSLAQLSPQQVQRIEVLRAATAEHGVQAVAGTINIILKEAPLQMSRDLKLGVTDNKGRAALNSSLSFGGRKGSLSFAVPLSFYQWSLPTETLTETGRHDAHGVWSGYSTAAHDVPRGFGFNAAPRLSYKLSADEELTLQTFYVANFFRNFEHAQTRILAGGAPESVDDTFTNRGRFDTWRLGLQYGNRFDEDTRLELKASLADGGARSRTRLVGLDESGSTAVDRPTQASHLGNTQLVGAKASRLMGDAHALTVGIEVERKRRHAQRATQALNSSSGEFEDVLPGFEDRRYTATSRRLSVYIQDEWEYSPQTSLNMGVRAERLLINSEHVDGRSASSAQLVAPLLHVTHKLSMDGRDMLRLSLTRSYRSPNLDLLLPRPTINTNYPTTGPNTMGAPDRVGNPMLRPELATGADLALERYLKTGGLVSIGGFYRHIDSLVRNSLVSEAVPWATVDRFVSRPENLSSAIAAGIELELKGRADEWLPGFVHPSPALQVRAALGVNWSKVRGLPGPDNRLDQQQPWSVNLSWEYRFQAAPLVVGTSFQAAPNFFTQLSELQTQRLGRTRTIDAFAVWRCSDSSTLRFAVANAAPILGTVWNASINGDSSVVETRRYRSASINWEVKL